MANVTITYRLDTVKALSDAEKLSRIGLEKGMRGCLKVLKKSSILVPPKRWPPSRVHISERLVNFSWTVRLKFMLRCCSFLHAGTNLFGPKVTRLCGHMCVFGWMGSWCMAAKSRLWYASVIVWWSIVPRYPADTMLCQLTVLVCEVPQ